MVFLRIESGLAHALAEMDGFEMTIKRGPEDCFALLFAQVPHVKIFFRAPGAPATQSRAIFALGYD
jgi:hypothetical protein